MHDPEEVPEPRLSAITTPLPLVGGRSRGGCLDRCLRTREHLALVCVDALQQRAVGNQAALQRLTRQRGEAVAPLQHRLDRIALVAVAVRCDHRVDHGQEGDGAAQVLRVLETAEAQRIQTRLLLSSLPQLLKALLLKALKTRPRDLKALSQLVLGGIVVAAGFRLYGGFCLLDRSLQPGDVVGARSPLQLPLRSESLYVWQHQ